MMLIHSFVLSDHSKLLLFLLMTLPGFSIGLKDFGQRPVLA